MAENLNIGMAPSGEEKVKQALQGVEEKAKQITMRFNEATAAAQKSGKTVQEEVGGKGKRALEETDKTAAALGRTMASVFSVAAVTAMIRELDRLDQKIAETGAKASRSLVGTLFGTGDFGDAAAIQSQLTSLDSPLAFEQRVGVFGGVRGTAPFADQAAVMRATERLATTGAVAAGMDQKNIDQLAALSGEFLARGFSPDQSTDLAAQVLMMGGNQALTTRAFGIADQLGAEMGMGGQQATLTGLSTVMAAQRQGLRLPTGGNVQATLGAVDPALRNQILGGLMQSRGTLDRAAAAATGVSGYGPELARQSAVTGIDIDDLRTGRALMAQERAAASAETRRQLSSNFGTIGRMVSPMMELWQRMSMNQDQQWQQARAQLQTRVRIESDDPSVRMMGSPD